MNQLIATKIWHQVEINLPNGMYSTISAHMLDSLEKEQFGIVLAGYSYTQQKSCLAWQTLSYCYF